MIEKFKEMTGYAMKKKKERKKRVKIVKIAGKKQTRLKNKNNYQYLKVNPKKLQIPQFRP